MHLCGVIVEQLYYNSEGILLLNLLVLYRIGEYHQYDNMAYPNIKSESKMVKFIKFWKWGTSSDNTILVPDHDSTQSYSLKIYLERYANDLSTCKISNSAMVTEEIMHIYQSLKDPYVMVNDPTLWRANNLPMVRLLCFFGTFIT